MLSAPDFLSDAGAHIENPFKIKSLLLLFFAELIKGIASLEFGAECARFTFLSSLNLSFLKGHDSLSNLVNCCSSFHLLAFAGLFVISSTLLNCKFHFIRLFALALGQVSTVRCNVLSLLLSEIERGVSVIECVRLWQRMGELEGSCLESGQGKQGRRCVER